MDSSLKLKILKPAFQDNTYLGSITLSSDGISAYSLNVLKGRLGGYLNGVMPKLNRHCWKDMKLAAAKKPVLERGKGRECCTICEMFLCR